MSDTQLPVTGPLARWLRDYNEAPWRRYIDFLKERNLLATVDGILVDARTIFKTNFRCDTRTCAGLDRDRRTESCCTDYQVEITPEEQKKILDNDKDVIALLNRYEPDRVPLSRSVKEFFKESTQIELEKEKGRCGFSYRNEEGQLRCGLHSLALERGAPLVTIKPLVCIFFPVVVYHFESGETLLTAISDDTADLMEGEKDTALPCLRAPQGGPMYKECRTAIETGFGADFYHHLEAVAGDFVESKPHPAIK